MYFETHFSSSITIDNWLIFVFNRIIRENIFQSTIIRGISIINRRIYCNSPNSDSAAHKSVMSSIHTSSTEIFQIRNMYKTLQ